MARLPYSDTLPPEEAQTVRRIPPPPGCAEFRSEILASADGGTQIWEQAWLENRTGRWIVDEHFVTREGPGHIRPLWRGGISFFDALRECGEFEKFERSGGKTPATELFADADTAALPHYLQVCKDAGQGWDTAGLPLPSAGGHLVLARTVFLDTDARAALKKSRDVELLPETRTHALQDTLDALISAPEATADIIESAASATAKSIEQKNLSAANEQQTKDLYTRAVDSAKQLPRAIEIMSACHFLPPRMKGHQIVFENLKMNCGTLFYPSLLLLAPSTAIVEAVVTVISGGRSMSEKRLEDTVGNFDLTCLELNMPETDFRRKITKLRDAADRLPDVGIKTMLHDFAKAAGAARHLEHAAHYKHRASEQRTETKAKKFLDKGLAQVGLAAQALGLPPQDNDAQRLKLSFTTSAFPERGHFLKDLKDSLQKIESSVAEIHPK